MTVAFARLSPGGGATVKRGDVMAEALDAVI